MVLPDALAVFYIGKMLVDRIEKQKDNGNTDELVKHHEYFAVLRFGVQVAVARGSHCAYREIQSVQPRPAFQKMHRDRSYQKAE